MPELPDLLAGADLAVVRILGTARSWADGLEAVRATGAPVVVLGGEQTPDAELMAHSTVPVGTALALDATIYPSLHWHWIGPLMAIIVVGGLGSVPGAAIAAMVLGVSQSLLQIPMGTTWAQTVFYIVLFATLVFRPHGFFGGRLAQRF